MTEGPSPNVAQKFQYKYDAWNRLVQVFIPVVSSSNPYVQYEYDGLNRLIVRQADPGADGTIDETRQFYVSAHHPHS